MSGEGKRGVDRKPKAVPRRPLSPTPPKDLKGRAREIYRRLAKELAVEGYVCQADWRTVALLARTEEHAENLEAEVAKLGGGGLTVETKAGPKIHPLLVELRAVRGQVASLYGALFITPRSRSSSRLTADSGRQQPTPQTDELDRFLAAGER